MLNVRVEFTRADLLKLWQPKPDSTGEDNGQVTIIGGSGLFHGAPLFSLRAASRLVDMVFFASPDPAVGRVAEKLKSRLSSFIWVPWTEVEAYVAKSEASLVGPGFMRFKSERATDHQRIRVCDEECLKTQEITHRLLDKFPQKRWVIDGGSLQAMAPTWIPPGAVLTPNRREFELLFGRMGVVEAAKKNRCVMVYKGPTAVVTDGETTYEVNGGNAGLTKGGTGDVLAGVVVGLLAKNPPLLAAAAGTYLVKKTAEYLYKRVGYHFNADDLSESVFAVYHRLL